jgi:hypothetical protein
MASDATDATCCGPGFGSLKDAMRASPEKLLCTGAPYLGTGF